MLSLTLYRLSSHGQKIPSNVRWCVNPGVPATDDADINSELDELDREEFYRLKKVSSTLHPTIP
jgi:hypothetical protein